MVRQQTLDGDGDPIVNHAGIDPSSVERNPHSPSFSLIRPRNDATPSQSPPSEKELQQQHHDNLGRQLLLHTQTQRNGFPLSPPQSCNNVNVDQQHQFQNRIIVTSTKTSLAHRPPQHPFSGGSQFYRHKNNNSRLTLPSDAASCISGLSADESHYSSDLPPTVQNSAPDQVIYNSQKYHYNSELVTQINHQISFRSLNENCTPSHLQKSFSLTAPPYKSNSSLSKMRRQKRTSNTAFIESKNFGNKNNMYKFTRNYRHRSKKRIPRHNSSSCCSSSGSPHTQSTSSFAMSIPSISLPLSQHELHREKKCESNNMYSRKGRRRSEIGNRLKCLLGKIVPSPRRWWINTSRTKGYDLKESSGCLA